MPIIANAKKALRQSKKRNARNRTVRANMRVAVKQTGKSITKESLSQLFSTVDKAVKKNIIHKNKAARLKSRAAKLAATQVVKTVKKAAKPKKTTVKVAKN
jgi:small subunit ribosomal protein S20